MNSTRQNRHVYASTSNDHSISDGETELETFQGNNHIANRRDQAAEYYVEQLLLHFKRKAGQRRYGQAKKFEETTKVTCWWCWDADVLQSSRSRIRSGVPAATCVGMLRYSMTTTRKVKDLCSPRGAKKKVFLGTSSTVTLLEKNHARNVGQFWNFAGIFLDYRRIIQA